MSLDQWDEQISPRLQEIELSSGWIGFYVRKIEQAAAELVAKAPFDTNAIEALDKARKDLGNADQRLREARLAYMKKEQVA